MPPPRIAICYWGLTRSTSQVYQTHQQYMYTPLSTAGYTYDVFVHTWRTPTPKTWNDIDPPIDEEEGHLLGPKVFQIDDQEAFWATVPFADYFDEDLWNRFGDNGAYGEWPPYLIKNHICALESMRRVYTAAKAGHYDFYIFIRPDVELVTPFPAERLATLGPNDILLTDFSHGEGYNDRFAVMQNPEPYATRLDMLKEFRKRHGRIVSEKVVKACIDAHYTSVTFVEFPMRRVRVNGFRADT
jgi:hypothetical protein